MTLHTIPESPARQRWTAVRLAYEEARKAFSDARSHMEDVFIEDILTTVEGDARKLLTIVTDLEPSMDYPDYFEIGTDYSDSRDWLVTPDGQIVHFSKLPPLPVADLEDSDF